MADYPINELATFEWMPSRIPAFDALVTVIPDEPRDGSVDSFAMSHRSRFFPTQGGTRVLVSFEVPTEYDGKRWHIEKDAWDHEHCELCRQHVPSMTLCWVTKSDPYVLLCGACHSKVAASATPRYRKIISGILLLLKKKKPGAKRKKLGRR